MDALKPSCNLNKLFECFEYGNQQLLVLHSESLLRIIQYVFLATLSPKSSWWYSGIAKLGLGGTLHPSVEWWWPGAENPNKVLHGGKKVAVNYMRISFLLGLPTIYY